MLKRNQKGFTLIELLIVVAIIGIIAAIAIPNLLNAIQRGKQKRTMGDVRTVGTAMESYSIDNNRYPIGADVSSIAASVEPTYIKKAPQLDGWGTAFALNVPTAANEYTIISYGKDRQAGGPAGTTYNNLACTDFRDDIVFSTGTFTQSPDGSQQ